MACPVLLGYVGLGWIGLVGLGWAVFGYMCLIGSSRWEEGVLGGDWGRKPWWLFVGTGPGRIGASTRIEARGFGGPPFCNLTC